MWAELGEGKPGAHFARAILRQALLDLQLLKKGIRPNEEAVAPPRTNRTQRKPECDLCPKCGILSPKPDGFVCAITDCPNEVVKGPIEFQASPLNEDPATLVADALDWFENPGRGAFSLDLICEVLNANSDAWTYAARRAIADPKKKIVPPGARKLTVADRQQIFVLHEHGGLSTFAVAEMFGVDRSYVSKIFKKHRLDRASRKAGRSASRSRNRRAAARASTPTRWWSSATAIASTLRGSRRCRMNRSMSVSPIHRTATTSMPVSAAARPRPARYSRPES